MYLPVYRYNRFTINKHRLVCYRGALCFTRSFARCYILLLYREEDEAFRTVYCF